MVGLPSITFEFVTIFAIGVLYHKIFAWYDNEWGYSNRLIEQVVNVGSHTLLTKTENVLRI